MQIVRGCPRPGILIRGLCRATASARRRHLLTLAIETSCDDTSVAILETWNRGHRHGAEPDETKSKDVPLNPRVPSTKCAHLHFHEKVTADNIQYRGIHPIASLDSHQQNLALLVSRALASLPTVPTTSESGNADTAWLHVQNSSRLHRKPDFVSVTRGPGMRASLATGLDVAKGLAVAWQVPLLGVHHMQAHALTPRLVAALDARAQESFEPVPSQRDGVSEREKPSLDFPLLTLLVSGGHSLLLHSQSLTSHRVLANTVDIAVGDAIDKMSRDILPADIIASAPNTMYGALLEKFAFPHAAPPADPRTTANHGLDNAGDAAAAAAYDYGYTPPATRGQEIERRATRFGWALTPPLADVRELKYSFGGLPSHVRKLAQHLAVRSSEGGGDETEATAERLALAREAQRLAFEHLASRVVLALDASNPASGRRKHKRAPDPDGDSLADVKTLVVSGGVAANSFLRHVLRRFLDARGYAHVRLVFPPLALCTDNAAMVAWTGCEMYGAGWRSGLGVQAVPVWGMDSRGPDGGILGIGGWERR